MHPGISAHPWYLVARVAGAVLLLLLLVARLRLACGTRPAVTELALGAAAGMPLNQLLHLAGYPDVSMLLSALVALALLGPYVRSPKWRGRSGLRKLVADSFAPIAGVLVILPAAGGLSGVLRDSGAAQATVQLAMGAHIPPLILAWLLAAVVRWDRPPLPWLWPRARSRRSPVAGPMVVRPEMLVQAPARSCFRTSMIRLLGLRLLGLRLLARRVAVPAKNQGDARDLVGSRNHSEPEWPGNDSGTGWARAVSQGLGNRE